MHVKVGHPIQKLRVPQHYEGQSVKKNGNRQAESEKAWKKAEGSSVARGYTTPIRKTRKVNSNGHGEGMKSNVQEISTKGFRYDTDTMC